MLHPTTPVSHPLHREFHVSRAARRRHGFDDVLFGVTGNVVLADFRAARELAHRINRSRPESERITPGQLNAIGLIDELSHLLVARYRRQHGAGILGAALVRLADRLGAERLDAVLEAFVDEFPPLAVHRGELSVAAYLAADTDGTANREVALEELLLLWLANANPAFAPLRELFDDRALDGRSAYRDVMAELETFFAGQPAAGPGGETLLDLLRGPMRVSPDSLDGQLRFIRSAWAPLLGGWVEKVLGSLDLLAEDWRGVAPAGPPPAEAPDYARFDHEPEAYSADLDWMPRVVMLAKNVHVWLDQLSRLYERDIASLDGIPDAELERLSRWGFTALWLIGVWQRSRASARIKRRMGDTEAVASAYSLDDYRVADELGGDEAYRDLKERAGRHGIRMATDMVPNHMGIDSRWMIEHPDWFLGLDHSPFPQYSFTGPDLSDDGRVGIFLEDRYWDRSDAAVVFKRVDRWTGDERFVYHGNDGTSMPWNDTAQLDYRRADVREAVIQTILHVARQSPIIRFDAAMTLTKKHFQRLWFPEPGTGGDIPSRAEHGMSRRDFDRLMPHEFWREVVDRVAAEAPDTLLLAEAFWLLEGYFVRSLGMHRVYNSAFMNMLRDEKNAEYRQLIKSTLEFDPQILKRYVNFMSNPDERTAIDQFGSDDKYFGVATLLATLPGLPMFGHGQIEGFREKYGMEFKRPRWTEEPDPGLVSRHRRQLFPLLHRRRLFADVERFQLYDLYRADGSVDENVLAYSNAAGGERALVVFHNRYGDTRGWIRTAAASLQRHGDGGQELVQRTLAEGLGIAPADGRLVAWRDLASGLEHLHPSRDLAERGLELELGAYAHHVYLEIRELDDDADRTWSRLAERLAGKGVPGLEEARRELVHEGVRRAFRDLLAEPALLGALAPTGTDEDEQDVDQAPAAAAPETDAADLPRRAALFAARALEEVGGSGSAEDLAQELLLDVGAMERMPAALSRLQEIDAGAPDAGGAGPGGVVKAVAALEKKAPARLSAPLAAWSAARCLERAGTDDDGEAAVDLWRRWVLRTAVAAELEARGVDGSDRLAWAAELLLVVDGWWQRGATPEEGAGLLLEALLGDEAGRRLLGVNRYRGVDYFHRESFDEVLAWLLVQVVAGAGPGRAADAAALRALAILRAAEAARDRSRYRVDALRTESAAPDGDGAADGS